MSKTNKPKTKPFKPNKYKTADGLDNPNVTNGDRAAWADEAVDAFQSASRMENCGNDEVMIDLLCDLMHLCHRENIDFEACLRMGRNHYEAEA